MNRSLLNRCAVIAALCPLVSLLSLSSASAASYSVAYTDGGNWNTVYAQGFNTSLIDEGTAPSGLNNGDAVSLNQFQFYMSGTVDSASNIQLAIFNTMYPNTVGLTTSSSSFVGLSTNTIASTASLSVGAPIAFSFNNLPLVYGNDYSAVYVNVGGDGSLTPVLVSSLTANYALQSDSNYHPATNYGTETQYNYTTSNFISGGYFQAFGYAGDANFTASLSYTAVPEPCSLALAMGGIGLLTLCFRRRASKG
jgi:hypothetical protein